MNTSVKVVCLVALLCLFALSAEAQWYGGYYGGYPSYYGGYYGSYGYPYAGYGYGGYGYGGWVKREAGFPQQPKAVSGPNQ
ncbi:unnamed protein product, partial [Mesorhabditis spiculigera]